MTARAMAGGGATRRLLLQAGGSAAILTLAACAAGDRPGGGRNLFTLGVASGYPTEDGVVLWTRLAPEPLSPDGGGGMAAAATDVTWEIAEDDRFTVGVQRGRALASPAWGHSVHVEIGGLSPARPYWYRFLAGGEASPVGRTRTAPARGATIDRLRFAYASCQQFEQGWFTAHRHIAAEELDLMVFLGDYIYESSSGGAHVREHEAGVPETLAQYRNRHACYRGDPDLQACHAAFPWLVTWDDHEVENDYGGDRSERLWPREQFLRRRAAAYKAFYEHMPLPAVMRPQGPDMRIYTHVDYGTLARFHVLDDRQYRSPQVCPRARRGGSNMVGASCTERLDPALTLLGAAQEAWLDQSFASSPARWNVIAQQSLMSQLRRKNAAEELQVWTDSWDGYPAARRRLLDAMLRHRLRNPVVIGGDVHAFYVSDVKRDFDDPRGAVLASEICGTSITSQGPAHAQLARLAADNPHLKLADGSQRGYVSMTLGRDAAQAALRVVGSVKEKGAGLRTLASVMVQDGRPGPVLANA